MGSAASVFHDAPDRLTEEYLKERLGGAFRQDLFDEHCDDDGTIAAGRVGELMHACAAAAHKRAQWWEGLNAVNVSVGANAGAMKKVPQTEEEKIRFLFDWADQDKDGLLNFKETNRLCQLQGATITQEQFRALSKQLGFNPRRGMSLEVASKVWDDYEDDYQAVLALEKKRFMFKWADKDGNGYISKEEFVLLIQLSDPKATASDEEWRTFCAQYKANPRKGLNWEAAKKLWAENWEPLHEEIQKDEKCRVMFQWADKDWDGYLNRQEANALQKVNNPNDEFTEEIWNAVAQQLGFDPNKGFDYALAKSIWEDYEEDYEKIFGQEKREAQAAQLYISQVVPCWKVMLEDENNSDNVQFRKVANAIGMEDITCDEESSTLAFAWLKRAIQTPHGSDDFKQVKLCVRALLSSDAFWKGLGCHGHAWSLEGDLKNDVEWTEFIALCKQELAKIGDRYKGYYDEYHIGDKIGHLGSEVPAAVVRQPFPPCDNLPLRGPGEKFLNDATGEDQYLAHIVMLSHAFNHRFQQKIDRVVRDLTDGEPEEDPSLVHHPAPVKTMLRMCAKLRGDHFNNPAPRSSANIDTIRCGVSCDTAEDLERAYNAVKAEFGGKFVRVKNGYSKDYDPNISIHYRGLLVNIEWHTGVKYGDLHKDPSIVVAWDLWSASIVHQPFFSCTDFEAAIAGNGWKLMKWFQDPKIADKEVVLMVEVQFMLDHYMNMRQHTHLYYKVVREPTWADLGLDCLPDNVEVVAGNYGE